MTIVLVFNGNQLPKRSKKEHMVWVCGLYISMHFPTESLIKCLPVTSYWILLHYQCQIFYRKIDLPYQAPWSKWDRFPKRWIWAFPKTPCMGKSIIVYAFKIKNFKITHHSKYKQIIFETVVIIDTPPTSVNKIIFWRFGRF